MPDTYCASCTAGEHDCPDMFVAAIEGPGGVYTTLVACCCEPCDEAYNAAFWARVAREAAGREAS
jgi:hypothetical protein